EAGIDRDGRDEHVECRVSRSVGGRRSGPEPAAALEIILRETAPRGLFVEIEVEGGRGRGLQRPDYADAAAFDHRRGDVREVLRIDVAVADVVGRDAVAAEVDAEKAVVVDRVAADRVSGAGRHDT